MSSRGSERGIRKGNLVVKPKQERRGGNSSASTSNVSRYYRSMTLTDFLKNGPPQFNGNANALEADQWFREVERISYTQHIPEVQSVEIVTHMLEGDAQNWWQELCHTLQVELTDVPWHRFKIEFYGRYFLHAFRIAKELELMQLKQKDMSVADYTREFDNLCRFSKICQGNPADYEERKCAQYEKGLSRDIFNYVYPQKLTNFTELAKKSQLAEDRCLKWTLLQEGFGETAPEEPHRAGLRMCFRYGAPGHMSRDCPRGRAANTGWP
ncbi:uncharacterized protein LOC130957651 [Arachis stenosperma]|uniref:uncharacterized protein LOC130957651 n=1 Tax=Arachis stenosperma TaxID=217475 RepID=UPI0025AD90AD|nr:uncharacterized protein LOC130957651 [Arachis stenosperma]